MSGKVITRILGGLGNQLFCYAAARRLALANDAELVIDSETGFLRDTTYRREYSLGAFSVAGRPASNAEMLRPFERARRKLLRLQSQRQPFAQRRYIDDSEGQDFDPRLLERRVLGQVWLDGNWQSENYFADIANIIRDDLAMASPEANADLSVAAQIRASNAVALHVRWFTAPGSISSENVSPEYYRRAILQMRERLDAPKFFVFSDNPEATVVALELGSEDTVIVAHNSTARDGAISDFRLMRMARHFVIANSTFSWWAAWLGEDPEKLVIAPSTETVTARAWGLRGLIPTHWQTI